MQVYNVIFFLEKCAFSAKCDCALCLYFSVFFPGVGLSQTVLLSESECFS